MDIEAKLFEMVEATHAKVDATNDKLSKHIEDEAVVHGQILGELKLLNTKREQASADLESHMNYHRKWERRGYYMLTAFFLFIAERAWAFFAHKPL